jgi:hypothetical protein
LEELAQLADTAGLTVVGTTYQKYVCWSAGVNHVSFLPSSFLTHFSIGNLFVEFFILLWIWLYYWFVSFGRLENPSPKTYIGAGKVSQVASAVKALKVETVIFDDELSPGWIHISLTHNVVWHSNGKIQLHLDKSLLGCHKEVKAWGQIICLEKIQEVPTR